MVQLKIHNNMKECSKCKVEKEMSEFSKDKQKKSGYRPCCKVCQRKAYKKPTDKSREAKRKIGLKFLKDNPDYKKTCSKCKESLEASQFNYNYKSKDGLGFTCKPCERQYIVDNKEVLRIKAREYRKNNRDKIREGKNRLHNKRMAEDSLYNFEIRTRKMVYNSFRRGGFTKNSRVSELLCINYEDLMVWLNGEASNGLSFESDKIHIDHVIPINKAINEEEVAVLNHYSNLQLMTAFDNISKSDDEPSWEEMKRVFSNHNNPEKVFDIMFN
jgi:hypothetical protein